MDNKVVILGEVLNVNREKSDNWSFIGHPWDCIKSRLLKRICHFCLSPYINSFFRIPFKSIWLNIIFPKSIGSIILVCSAHYYSLLYPLSRNKKMKRRVKITLQFPDKVEYFQSHYRNFPSIEKIKEMCSLVISYNIVDCQQYCLLLSRPRMMDYSFVGLDLSIPKSDLFFVGRNKGRVDTIHELYEKAVSHGLTCDFTITDVEDEKKIHKEGIKYNKYMPYDEVLKHVLRTNCVVNCIQEGGAGLTLREYEAFGNGKFLLTDDYSIKSSVFYNSIQVILFSEFDKRIDDIKKGYNPTQTDFLRFSTDNWVCWLKTELQKRKIIE